MFKTVLKGINKVEESIIIALLGGMTIAAFLQVVGRYTPLPFTSGLEEILRYAFVFVTMLAGAVAVRKKAHQGVDFLVRFIPKKFQVYVNLWCNSISILVSMTLAIIAFRLVVKIQSIQQVTPSLGMPMWLIASAIPIGFALMLFYFAILLAQDVRSLLQKERKES